MSERPFYNDGGFWAAFLLPFLLTWMFCYYPAVVLGVTVCGWFYGSDPATGYIIGILVMIAGSFGLKELGNDKQKNILIWIYSLTLWPYLQLILWFLPDGGKEQAGYDAIFPGFDWIPFLFN